MIPPFGYDEYNGYPPAPAPQRDWRERLADLITGGALTAERDRADAHARAYLDAVRGKGAGG